MSGKDLVFTILGIDRASPAFDKAGRSVDRFGNKLEKFGNVGVKSLLGVQAAGIASGAAIAGAIGATPLLFGAMAAAAVSGNKEVQDSFKNLASNVRTDVKSMAEPLAGEFIDVAEQLNTTFQRRVGPALRMAFADPALKHGISEVTGGITDLVSNSLPGFLTLLQRSQPVMTGFRSLLGDVGTGFTDFSRNISESSEGAGRVVTGLGRITSDALGDVGSLLSKLTDAVAPNMGRIESIFDRATNSALNLAENALPAMSGATGAALGVLDSALGVLEPISGTLGTVAGVSLAAAGGWRVLTGAGNKFTELDLGGKLERTALSAGVMTESLTGSAVAGERVATAGSRMASVLNGVGKALPLVGIAAVGLALAVEASNKHLDEGAARGASFAESLIKGGSEADRASAQIAKLNGESSSLQRELAHLKDEQANAGEGAYLFSEAITSTENALAANKITVETARSKYQEIKDSLTGAELAQVQYNEAVEAHGSKSTEAATAGAVLRAELDKEAEASRNASDAIKTHIDRLVERQAIMLGAAGADLNYRGALLEVDQAQKNLTDTLVKHTAESLQGRAATLAYEGALQGAIAAAGAKAQAENAGRSETEQAAAATNAQATEILRLAAVAGTNAPASLMSMVRGLDAATLAAIGVTGRVDETGAAIYRLPDGKEIRITGENQDAKNKITEINNMSVANKKFYIDQITRISQIRNPSDPNAYSPGVAEGGPVKAGQIYTVGERGRETFVPNVDGAILNNGETLALGRGGGGNTLVVNFHNHAPIGSQSQLQDWFTRTFDDLKRKGRIS